MTLKFPVAVWQDAQGSFTARVLDGAQATAIDASASDVLGQLKKYLAWCLRKDAPYRSDFDDLELRDHRVRIRPEYATDGAAFPVREPFHLRITCVHGKRQGGTRHCVIPTLDLRFSYQQGDPIDELVAETVQQVLGKKTPQELSRELMPMNLQLDAVHVGNRPSAQRSDETRYRTLEAVSDPLSRRTRGARFPGAIQRDDAVRMVVDRLSRDKANLLLLGESGVGKTTVLVQAIHQVLRPNKTASPIDADKAKESDVKRQFWRTTGQRLISGMKYLGQWEERCEQVVEELAETNSVLCVEDLLELVRVGGREPGASVAAFLMPYLERGELRMVAEATPTALDACRRLLPGLAEMFQIVRLPEFSAADARTVLATLLDEGRRNQRLEYESGLGDVICRLFKRFQPYAAFPGRAASFVRHLLDDAARMENPRLTQAEVLARFQRETGLPQMLLRDDQPLPFDEVLAEFQEAVLGQPAACQVAAGVVTALKTGLNDPRRPLGVLLFCGPTGVGKTEMAKALARYLFGAGAIKDRLVRLDMSEYAGFGAAQRLVMTADGEVSDFIRRLRRQPFVVVLLDEIEKAAPEVHDMLLGVLDEGRLTDRLGRTTTFHSSVIVMTSNLGAERSAAIGFDGSVQTAFDRIAMRTFRPEFYNRIDSVVSFQPLSRETIFVLARRELEAIRHRDGLVKAGLRLTWTAYLVEHLATAGFDARYGARPLQRVIEQLVIAPLSHWLLENPEVRDRTISLVLMCDKVSIQAS
jgi:ATP-dependent Clp protease ATP-binding subunit ClpC